MQNALAGLAQPVGTLPAQVQLVADQKTAIADQPLTDGAVVHMFRGIPDGKLSGLAKLLLIEYIENDLPVPVFRFYPRF